jgi:hypothetical protein
MNSFRTLLPLALACIASILAGCAATGGTDGGMVLPMRFTYQGQPAASPYAPGEGGYVIRLHRGSGDLLRADTIPSAPIRPMAEGTFVLDDAALRDPRRDGLQVLDTHYHPRITIAPADTRLQRISPWTFDAWLLQRGFERDAGYTRLHDALGGDDLILLAVDRACRIGGELNAGDEDSDLDVTLDGPGIHFLRVHRSPGAKTRIVAAGKAVRPQLIVDFYPSYVHWLEENPPSLKDGRRLPVIRNAQ